MEKSLNTFIDRYLGFLWAKRQTMLRYYLRNKPDSPSLVDTPEQYAIISILDSYGHGVPIGDIASQIDIPHANVSRTLNRLEKKGLIRRTRGKSDKRQVYIHLSLEGKKAARLAGRATEKLHKTMWGELSEEEAQTLHHLFRKLIQS
ncbi:MAG: MarR family transcriptional regulator [Candidatus Zixiibacteriota bacterium]